MSEIENVTWKQRFKQLEAMTQEMISQAEIQRISVSTKRHSVCSKTIYVSFDGDVISSDEQIAIKYFGEGNYDVYRLWKKADK